VAAADSDRGRGDRRNDRESKSERSRDDHKRKQGDVRRRDGRDGRPSDRQVVETRRDGRDGRWSDRQVVERRRDGRDGRWNDRQVVETRRDGRDGRWDDRRVAGMRREPSRDMRERSIPRPARLNEHVVSRTATPVGWDKRALRGRAQYAAWDGHRARHWRSEHRSWRARGGYHGYWIPDYRYRVVFGPRHRFRVDRCPLLIVSGYPRFYYGGYWVTFIDPWPEYWADDWFAQDDCYVLYDDDGYYLTNVRHPEVRIAISFTLG